MNEITFHPLSFVDPDGQLFYRNKELYRAISSERSCLYQDLFDRGIIQELIDKNILVETEIYSFELEGYDLILKHRSIAFISYPYEWCDLMFKDAALLHMEFVCELTRHNLTSKDAKSWNILFDGCKPIFVDFCSIVPIDERSLWPGITSERFRYLFIYPLYLMSQGYGRIARSFVRDSNHLGINVLRAEIEVFYIKKTVRYYLYKYLNKIIQFGRINTPIAIRPVVKDTLGTIHNIFLRKEGKARSDFINSFKKEVNEIKLPPYIIEKYTYYDCFFASFLPSDDWTKKQHSINSILSTLTPKSVLDIDSDYGWYAQLAAYLGSQVIAFDDNENCVKKLYLDAKKEEFSITPLVLDFTAPTFGLTNDHFDSVYDRLKCDLVLALTLFHHLLLKSHINLEKVLNRLSKLSNRWLVVEFIPRENLAELIPPQDQFSRERLQHSKWYSLEEFIQKLEANFQEVTVFSSFPKTRKLLLCEKKAKA